MKTTTHAPLFRLVAVASIATASLACARPNYVSTSTGAQSQAATGPQCAARFGDECFNVQWETVKFGGRNFSSFLLRIGRPNQGDGSLIVADTVATSAEDLDVELSMPEMGHGTGPVHVAKVDVGTYRVTHVYLPHGGLWEIRVRRAREGRAVDEAALRQTL